MEKMFEQQGQRMEGLLFKQEWRISMPEDTLLTTAKRTQTKTQSLGEMFERKLTHVGEAQTAKRNEEIKRLEEKIDKMATDRNNDMNRLPAEKDEAQVGGCKPTRMILGYDGNLSREELLVRSRGFLKTLGNDKEMTFDPYAPWKFGDVCKVRCKDGFLSQVLWAARKNIEDGASATAPKWATEERSPRK